MHSLLKVTIGAKAGVHSRLDERQLSMERRPLSLARCLIACLPVALLLVASGTGMASAARVPVNARAAALASLRHLMLGEHGTNRALGGQPIAGRFGPKKVTSHNWSGYADDGGKTYTLVTARWKEPSATCPPKPTDPNTMAAFWVGIDGYASGSVEQDGTLAYCDQGKPYYYTWWEMAPKNAIQVVGNSVAPGDQITASVSARVTSTYTQYMLKVTDSNLAHPKNSFTEYKTCGRGKCLNSSAEWIAEAPTGSKGQYPLAHFSTWAVNAASVKSGTSSGTISTFPAYQITMTANTTVLALPGSLNQAGDWFADTWKAGGGTG
jgi:Peptidase A4 family